eukprot:TRINITY_DN210_c2_g1_i3.p2 TRINITY_DN210_c2_g1~~TRINITY_DN210_c2_g1_i3.p2  ORF type:complete len:99 (+),score=14.53 TRINITY_DN210_c2_g1_i3:306-602(+)
MPDKHFWTDPTLAVSFVACDYKDTTVALEYNEVKDSKQDKAVVVFYNGKEKVLGTECDQSLGGLMYYGNSFIGLSHGKKRKMSPINDIWIKANVVNFP